MPTYFNFASMPNNINVGDRLYYSSSGTPVEVGVITNVGPCWVSVDSVISTPPADSFMFVAKPSVAESYGLKGYYASVKLTNEESGPVELFAVNSEVSKSFM